MTHFSLSKVQIKKMSSALRMVANNEFLSMNLKNFTVIPYLLSPFSMTASSSSGVLLDDRCLFKKEFSLQTFAMFVVSGSAGLEHTDTENITVTAPTLDFYEPEVIQTNTSHFPHGSRVADVFTE